MADDTDKSNAPPPPSSSRNDHTSPFFIGSQDRPGDLITLVRLPHDNYNEWARSVRLALLSRRKFGFVDGTIMEPKAPFTTEDCLTIHSMPVSWLMNTMDQEVKSTISFYDDAKLFLGKAHENRRNHERFHQFLTGLNSDYYAQLRTTLLSQEPLSSLDRAYQQITQEERVRAITRARESPPEVVGFAIRLEGRGRAKPENIDKSGLMCSHCH
ncbi:uncharacterized protein LOC142525938 [Primulina tabacum]|uniref:uncharacterized protein LOC142525938 n=1 Tax=Primulina tabacum TaxID=48773 RepID=UPI003F5ACC15